MRPTPHSLTTLLRRADPAAGADPALDAADFSAGVHARIRSADTGPLSAARRLGRHLFPLAAALAVLASVGAGSAVASARARDARAETFATAYARSIDPWQMHGTSAAEPAVSHVHATTH